MTKAQFVPKLNKTNQPWTIKRLRDNKSILHFDLAIQRRGVWKVSQKSDLIHTLIYGYDVPKVYAQDKGDDDLWFLDGKQRISSILEFLNEEYMLAPDTAAIPVFPKYAEEVLAKEMEERKIAWETWDGVIFDEDNEEVDVVFVKIAGHHFSTLPHDFQQQILDQKITITRMTGLSDEERDTLFKKLNNGTALKSIELTRVYAGSKVMSEIDKISSRKFFHDIVAITGNSRTHFADEDVIFQTILLIEANKDKEVDDIEGVEIGGAATRAYAISKHDSGLPADIVKILADVTDYLNKTFSVTEFYLRKVHIPMLFMVAWKRAMVEGMTPEKFGGWVQQFFTPLAPKSKLPRSKNQREYRRNSEGSTAKTTQVTGRLGAILNEFDDTFMDAPDYKLPVPKVTSRKRKNAVEGENEIQQGEQQVAATEATLDGDSADSSGDKSGDAPATTQASLNVNSDETNESENVQIA